MIELYDYQEDLIEGARNSFRQGNKRVVLQAPTGAGKTVIGSAIAKSVVNKGGSILIIAHRIELISQWKQSLTKLDLADKIGLITADSKPDFTKPIQIGMIQTISRRRIVPKNIDLVLCDEAHHSVANNYKRLFEAYNDKYILGVTATPARLDGKGLVEVFQDLIVGPSTGDLIDRSKLAPYRYFVPELNLNTRMLKGSRGDYTKDSLAEFENENKVLLCASLVNEYLKLANGLRSLVFVQSVDQAYTVAKAFNTAGVPAVALSGDSHKELRKSEVARFASGEIKVMVSVDIFGEGTDLPAVEVAQLARPTQSLCVYLQQVGRVLRYLPGKTALIIDHVNNVTKHGLPCEEREWELNGRVKNKRTGKKLVRDDNGEMKLEDAPELEVIPMQQLVELNLEKQKASRDAVKRFDHQHWDDELDRLTDIRERKMLKPGWLYYTMMDAYKQAGVLPSMKHLRELCARCEYAPGKAFYAYGELRKHFRGEGSEQATQGLAIGAL